MEFDTLSSPPPRRGRDKEKLAVVLVGVTESGKSTFISLPTQQDVEVDHGLESRKSRPSQRTRELRMNADRLCQTPDTTTAASYKFVDGNKEIILVVTPGFDDTIRPKVDTFTDLAQFLAALHKSKIRLAGIIYLHRITDPRFPGTAVKNLEILKRICGPPKLRECCFGHEHVGHD